MLNGFISLADSLFAVRKSIDFRVFTVSFFISSFFFLVKIIVRIQQVQLFASLGKEDSKQNESLRNGSRNIRMKGRLEMASEIKTNPEEFKTFHQMKYGSEYEKSLIDLYFDTVINEEESDPTIVSEMSKAFPDIVILRFEETVFLRENMQALEAVYLTKWGV